MSLQFLGKDYPLPQYFWYIKTFQITIYYPIISLVKIYFRQTFQYWNILKLSKKLAHKKTPVVWNELMSPCSSKTCKSEDLKLSLLYW